MEDRLSRLESRVEESSRLLEGLSRRVSSLEERLAATGESTAGPTPPSLAPDAEDEDPFAYHLPSQSQVVQTLSYLGRGLVVLGGAFLLRAITDYGVVPRVTGVLLGLAYAFLWIVAADLVARKKKSTSAGFHAAASAVIAFPLLWEANTKFDLLSSEAAAAAVAAMSLLGLGVTWHRGLQPTAWIFAVGSVCTASALAWATRDFVPFTCALLLLGGASLWLAYLRDWHGLGFFVAFVLDATILLLTVVVLVVDPSRRNYPLAPESLMVLQLLLVLLYLGSYAARTLLRRRNIVSLEVMQTVAVLLIGVGGAIWVAHSTATARVPVTLASVLLAIGFYAGALVILDRREGERQNFIYYTTLGLTFALLAPSEFLGRDSVAPLFAGLGALAASLGSYYSRVTLTGHSAVYSLVAALSFGLVAALADSFGSSPRLDRWLTVPALTTLGAICVSCWIRAPTHSGTLGKFARVPKLVLISIAVCSLYGLAVSLLLSVVTGSGGSETHAGVAALLRTGVLAAGAVVLAWLGRRERFFEATWLVLPVLVIGGLKLLFDDLPSGQPATLFASFALFGGALILAPWLSRRKQ